MYNAIVLAGGVGKDVQSGAPVNEALLDIGGRPMLFFVLNALEKCADIDRIFVAGPVRNLKHLNFADNVELVQSGAGIMDTVAAGMKAANTAAPVLICTVDLPFLTAEAVGDFIAKCRKTDADLYYPVIERELVQKKFPEGERTYVRMKDGTFTGGNLFLVNPAILPQCMAFARHVVDARKKPWRIASLLGWAVLLRFAFGFLSIEEAALRLSAILGIKACAIRSSYPEIGMDVDRPNDLALAKKYLIGKQ